MGCEPINGPGFTGIICTRGGRAPRCHYCNKPGTFLCDHPVIRKGGRGTCDTRMCSSCKNNGDLLQPAPDVDLCRPHFKLWRNNGNKFKLGDVEVVK